MNLWTELGIAPTRDRGEIRRAYAARVKQVHPEDNPADFQRLRQAYEFALGFASQAPPTAVLPHVEAPTPPVEQPPRDTPLATGDTPSAPRAQEAAASVIDRLLATAPDARALALADAMKQDGWENLDFRAQFQTAAAHMMMSDFDRLLSLVPVFAVQFGWTQDRIVGGNLLTTEVVAREAARRWRLDVETSDEARVSGKREAMALLRQAPDESVFRDYALSQDDLDEMETLLKQMTRSYPAALRYELNYASVQWWQRYLHEQAAARPSPTARTGSSRFWFFPFVLLFVSMVSHWLSNESHYHYSPTQAERRSDLLSRSTYFPGTADHPWQWNATQPYRPGDVVQYGTNWWVARLPSVGDIPGVSLAWVQRAPLAGSAPWKVAPPTGAASPADR